MAAVKRRPAGGRTASQISLAGCQIPTQKSAEAQLLHSAHIGSLPIIHRHLGRLWEGEMAE